MIEPSKVGILCRLLNPAPRIRILFDASGKRLHVMPGATTEATLTRSQIDAIKAEAKYGDPDCIVDEIGEVTAMAELAPELPLKPSAEPAAPAAPTAAAERPARRPRPPN